MSASRRPAPVSSIRSARRSAGRRRRTTRPSRSRRPTIRTPPEWLRRRTRRSSSIDAPGANVRSAQSTAALDSSRPAASAQALADEQRVRRRSRFAVRCVLTGARRRRRSCSATGTPPRRGGAARPRAPRASAPVARRYVAPLPAAPGTSGRRRGSAASAAAAAERRGAQDEVVGSAGRRRRACLSSVALPFRRARSARRASRPGPPLRWKVTSVGAAARRGFAPVAVVAGVPAESPQPATSSAAPISSRARYRMSSYISRPRRNLVLGPWASSTHSWAGARSPGPPPTGCSRCRPPTSTSRPSRTSPRAAPPRSCSSRWPRATSRRSSPTCRRCWPGRAPRWAPRWTPTTTTSATAG